MMECVVLQSAMVIGVMQLGFEAPVCPCVVASLHDSCQLIHDRLRMQPRVCVV